MILKSYHGMHKRVTDFLKVFYFDDRYPLPLLVLLQAAFAEREDFLYYGCRTFFPRIIDDQFMTCFFLF